MRYIYHGLSLFCFILGIAGIFAAANGHSDMTTAVALAIVGVAGAIIFTLFSRRVTTT